MDEILKNNLIQTNIQLKHKYKNDEQNDKLKIEWVFFSMNLFFFKIILTKIKIKIFL